jgi:hypothetical protein
MEVASLVFTFTGLREAVVVLLMSQRRLCCGVITTGTQLQMQDAALAVDYFDVKHYLNVL